MKRKRPIILIVLGVAVAVPSFVLWRRAESPPIDLVGGVTLTYDLGRSPLDHDHKARWEETRRIVSARLDAWGARARVRFEAPERLRVELPGVDPSGVDELRSLLESTGDLSLRLVAPLDLEEHGRLEVYEAREADYLAADAEWIRRKAEDPSLEEPRPKPPDYIVRFETDRKVVKGVATLVPKPESARLLESYHGRYDATTLHWEPEGVVLGCHLARAYDTVDAQTFRPAVAFELTQEGAEALGKLTGDNVGRLLAIVIDGHILQVATIHDRITSRTQITGDFTAEEARGLAAMLRSGSLPVPITLVSQQAVAVPEDGASFVYSSGDVFLVAFAASLVVAAMALVALLTRSL